MGTATLDTVNAAESAELLTTGEAAKILGSSRQHVVDLCDRGDLPFVTIGTHRRIRRSDVEALRSRTLRLTRDQLRSLWVSHAVAGKLVADPDEALGRARRNLTKLQHTHTRGQGARWLAEWEHIINGPIEGVLDALTSISPRARELRQNSPFAGLLSDDERAQVLDAFRASRLRRMN
jgi:excisionase family DNA binding protein